MTLIRSISGIRGTIGGKQGEGGGTPTKYTKDKPNEVRQYLELCQDQDKVLVKNGKVVIQTEVHIPSMPGLALFLKVGKKTLYRWAERYEEFRHSLEEVMLMQEDKLFNGGLSGKYNATIAKLGLSSNHGYVDKSKDAKDEETLSEVMVRLDKEAKASRKK